MSSESEIIVYPAEKQQLEQLNELLSNYNSELETLNSKLPIPQYQVKTATPSNVQQTISPDTDYAALSGVVVNPISALMPESLEDYIMRREIGDFSLSLNGNVPAYACYGQTNLIAVYGNITSIGGNAFAACSELREITAENATDISANAFDGCAGLRTINIKSTTAIGYQSFRSCTTLESVDARSATSIGASAFSSTPNLKWIDVRNISTIADYGVSGASALEIFDMTNCDSAPTLGGVHAFPNSAWKGVVKNDTVKAAVQAATNWSTYASHIYTVAEIEALYGDTYDNLYLQWFGHARNEVQA